MLSTMACSNASDVSCGRDGEVSGGASFRPMADQLLELAIECVE